MTESGKCRQGAGAAHLSRLKAATMSAQPSKHDVRTCHLLQVVFDAEGSRKAVLTSWLGAALGGYRFVGWSCGGRRSLGFSSTQA